MTEITSGYLSSYSYMASRHKSGKVFVPVQPTMVVYSQLKHISGYASAQDGSVSLNKVYMLNALIDKVSSTKSPKAQTPKAESFPDSQLDKMIAKYHSQLADAIDTAKAVPYAIKPTGLQGNVVNVVA